mmetsp:Transcript_11336/g.26002  ORF Transcript_11336/g.26002 Transcript_11336/m.26002 type:complete len:243 (-) Transcript_11336:44-772(-)
MGHHVLERGQGMEQTFPQGEDCDGVRRRHDDIAYDGVDRGTFSKEEPNVVHSDKDARGVRVCGHSPLYSMLQVRQDVILHEQRRSVQAAESDSKIHGHRGVHTATCEFEALERLYQRMRLRLVFADHIRPHFATARPCVLHILDSFASPREEHAQLLAINHSRDLGRHLSRPLTIDTCVGVVEAAHGARAVASEHGQGIAELVVRGPWTTKYAIACHSESHGKPTKSRRHPSKNTVTAGVAS